MKIGVLTSSRADFGIYLPLLKALAADPFFDLRLLVFGTHLSGMHGSTITEIKASGFAIDQCVAHVLAADTPAAVSTSMALTAMKFATIWEHADYDLVFCLGDRYEMFSAVSAGVPYGVRFAHIHGGETTLGAIDNQFRHCLSLFAQLHFVATDEFAQRVAQITGGSRQIHVTGSLSLENLKDLALLSVTDIEKHFGIDLSLPTLLVTYHPETVQAGANGKHVAELIGALNRFPDHQIVITMPNADTNSSVVRNAYQRFAATRSNVMLVESLGTLGYFSCMQHSQLVVGNSSSGIIEAASFGKYVVNIGDRQSGRACSDNILHAGNREPEISRAIRTALAKGTYIGTNIYATGGGVQKIIEVIKEWSA